MGQGASEDLILPLRLPWRLFRQPFPQFTDQPLFVGTLILAGKEPA